jgi:hypothetical protein
MHTISEVAPRCDEIQPAVGKRISKCQQKKPMLSLSSGWYTIIIILLLQQVSSNELDEETETYSAHTYPQPNLGFLIRPFSTLCRAITNSWTKVISISMVGCYKMEYKAF